MAFSLTEFSATLNKYGIAKASSFAVYLLPPAAVKSEVLNDIPLLCETANIPGISFLSEENRYMGYGLTEKRPVQVAFEDFTVTIFGDGGGRVLDFLQKWFALVTNFDGAAPNSTYGIQTGLFNYPEEYWGTIELYLYNIAAESYQHFVLEKAFPSNLGAVPVGWEMTDTLMRIPVTFQYRSYQSTTLKKLATTATPLNNVTNSNSRDIDKLDKTLQNPDLKEYMERLDNSIIV